MDQSKVQCSFTHTRSFIRLGWFCGSSLWPEHKYKIHTTGVKLSKLKLNKNKKASRDYANECKCNERKVYVLFDIVIDDNKLKRNTSFVGIDPVGFWNLKIGQYFCKRC